MLTTLTSAETTRFLWALAALLITAHGGGLVLQRLGQPKVIGEILGGLALGPSFLGWAFPETYRFLFGSVPALGPALGAIYQLGLLLLMFCSGMEVRSTFRKGERRTSLWVTLVGTLFPLAVSFLYFRWEEVSPHLGPAQSRDAFVLIASIGVAITSIPVISRILADLKLLGTGFARIVLSAAVLEDLLLYGLLAFALSAAGAQSESERSLLLAALTNVASTAALIAFAAFVGPWLLRHAAIRRSWWQERVPAAGMLMLFLLLVTGVALWLGVAPMFGAFLAGVVAGSQDRTAEEPRQAIRSFSYSFFIPVYFALVGLRLDLLREFDPVFFVRFLAFACAIKLVSVYAGARIAGEPHPRSLNLAVAMNARGGPGIVLASVALDASLINGGFYAVLVLLSIVTSVLAGGWLSRIVRRDPSSI